jgi:predicted DNA-binding protein (MmcQ/YjbR family)
MRVPRAAAASRLYSALVGVRKSPPIRRKAAPGAPGGGGLRAVARRLRAFALSLPDAAEDFPWGERVAKVRGKVFVFLGADPVPGGVLGLSVKLPESADAALAMPFAKPTAYGLGKSGWVTATFEAARAIPVAVLEGWILESYRAVAGPRLSARLAEQPRGGSRATSSRPSRGRPRG